MPSAKKNRSIWTESQGINSKDFAAQIGSTRQDYETGSNNINKKTSTRKNTELQVIMRRWSQSMELSSKAWHQTALARLDALETDNIVIELVDADDDDEASLDDEDQVFSQRKHLKGAKRKTRQAKALEKLESAKKTRSFLDMLQEANLEALPAHVPTYLKAAVGPPSSSARRHYCSVCGFFANYTCTVCGARFCCCRCQKIHSDTRCQKFVA